MAKDKSSHGVAVSSGKHSGQSAGDGGNRDDPQSMVVELDVDGLRSMGIMISGQGVVVPGPKPRHPLRITLKVGKIEIDFNRPS